MGGRLLSVLKTIAVGALQSWAQLVERLMRSLTWQDVGFLLGLLALLTFRRSVTRWLDRMKGAKFGNASFELGQRGTPQPDEDAIRGAAGIGPARASTGPAAAPPSPPQAGAAARPRQVPSPVVAELIPAVQKFVDDALGQGAHDSIDVMTTTAAANLLMARFERLYGLIYGSQLAAVRLLATLQPPQPAQRSTLRQLYIESRGQWPAGVKRPSFGEWLAFMVNVGLVSTDGATVRLTDFGLAFAQYTASQQMPPRLG